VNLSLHIGIIVGIVSMISFVLGVLISTITMRKSYVTLEGCLEKKAGCNMLRQAEKQAVTDRMTVLLEKLEENTRKQISISSMQERHARVILALVAESKGINMPTDQLLPRNPGGDDSKL